MASRDCVLQFLRRSVCWPLAFGALGGFELWGCNAIFGIEEGVPVESTTDVYGVAPLGGAGGSTAASGGQPMAGGSGGLASGTGGASPAQSATPVPCTGCVELVAPLTGPNDGEFNTTLADQIAYQFVYATPVDFSDAVVTWRVAAAAPDENTFVQLYAQNGLSSNYAGAYMTVPLDPARFPANEFTGIVFDLASLAAAGAAGGPNAGESPAAASPEQAPQPGDGFDKSLVEQLGITIGVGDLFIGSTVLRVAIDQVGIVGVPGQPSLTFTTGLDGLAINNYQALPGMQAPIHHP